MILNPKTNRYLKKTSQAGKRLMKQLIADGVTPHEQKEQHPEDVCYTRPAEVCYTRPAEVCHTRPQSEPQKKSLHKANGVEKKPLHKAPEIKYNMSEEEFDSLYELPSDLTHQFKSYSAPKIMTAGAEIVSQDLRRFKNLTDREMDTLFKKMLIKKLADNEKNTCVEKPSKPQKNSTHRGVEKNSLHKTAGSKSTRKIKIIQPPSDSESESDSS